MRAAKFSVSICAEIFRSEHAGWVYRTGMLMIKAGSAGFLFLRGCVHTWIKNSPARSLLRDSVIKVGDQHRASHDISSFLHMIPSPFRDNLHHSIIHMAPLPPVCGVAPHERYGIVRISQRGESVWATTAREAM